MLSGAAIARAFSPRAFPPMRPISAMCAGSFATVAPPFFPAAFASSLEKVWAVPFACAALPPFEQIAAVLVQGAGTRAEIWNAKRWQAYEKSKALPIYRQVSKSIEL